VQWKALGGAPSADLWRIRVVESEQQCKRGGAASCRVWKALGGAPSPDELSRPVTPWTKRPPAASDPSDSTTRELFF
jgi:hypothetical protein